MLTQRLLVVIFLLPLFILFVVVGGWPYNLLIIAALGVAAWEYWRIFKVGGYEPSRFILISGAMLLATGRAALGFAWADLLAVLLIMGATAIHVFNYRAQNGQAALNFCITLAGIFYLGWLGPYLISLRSLPDGQWWLLLVLPASWAADSMAYFVGRNFGRRPMAPLLSPNKTWEGYLGGAAGAALFTTLLGALWGLKVAAITPVRGLLLGSLIGVFTPLGDLGESLIKRQFGVKDSSRLLPGHGGIFDRIDTWVWAAPIGYYFILLWL